MQDITHFKPRLHVFVCINDRCESKMPSCSPKITKENVVEVKHWLQEQGLVSTVYCTKTSCLGFCNTEGGVMCVWPVGRFVEGIRDADDIKQIILEEVAKL